MGKKNMLTQPLQIKQGCILQLTCIYYTPYNINKYQSTTKN